MEKCPKCGNKLSHVDVLCPRCGALVENVHIRLGLQSDEAASQSEKISSRSGDGSCKQSSHATESNAKPENDVSYPLQSAVRKSVPAASQLGQNDTGSLEDKAGRVANSYSTGLTPFVEKPPQHKDNLLSTIHGAKSGAPADESTISDAPAAMPAQPVTASAPRNEQKRSDRRSDKARDNFLEIVEIEALSAPPQHDTKALRPATDAQLKQPEPERRYRRKQSDDMVLHEDVPAGKRKKSAVVTVAIWVLLTAALFAAFYFLNNYVITAYGSYPAFFHELTGGKINLDTGAALSASVGVIVSETQVSGIPAHQFDVSAFGGTSVRVLPMSDVFEMENGKTSFVVTDEELARSFGISTYKDSFVSEDMSLVISTYKEELISQAPPLTLILTNTAYTRLAPAEMKTVTTDETVTLEINVNPGAVVYINNTNYTDLTDASGKLILVLPLDTIGENYYEVDVRETGHKTVMDRFTVVRELPTTMLLPDIAYLRVYEDSFECSGTTLPQASVTVTASGNVFSAKAAADGRFSLACSVKKIGLSVFGLRAACEGFAHAEAAVAVERLPEPSSYIAKARYITISEAAKRFSSLAGKAVHLTGSLENIEAASYIRTFSLISESDRLNCYYHGTADLETGITYQIYGTPDTISNSFYVMFVG